jgi:hypothetical protein
MASALGIPELQLGVVTMANRFNPARFEEHSTEIARKLLEILAPQIAAQPRAQFDPAGVDLRPYEGRYALAGGYSPLRVDAAGGKLVLTWPESSYPPESFLPLAPDQFSPEDSPIPIPLLTFTRAASGSVEKLSHAMCTFARIA